MNAYIVPVARISTTPNMGSVALSVGTGHYPGLTDRG
jgi:hypothetical protein